VADLRQRIGSQVHLSVVSFCGGFIKEGRPYRLLDVAPFAAPQDHPHPPKRAYPHMLVLASDPPADRPDEYWQSGRFHGGAVNLAHVGSVTTVAFPDSPQQFLYANLQLLAHYHAKAPRRLLAEGAVPERVTAVPPSLPGDS
jgi:hypothetical protein